MTSAPAPDPQSAPPGRLRLVPAPQSQLPYDDERADPPLIDRRPRRLLDPAVGVQGTLALAFPLPSGVPAVPTPSPRLRIVGRELTPGFRRRPHPSGSPTEPLADRPEASRWVALIAQAIVEAEVGDRPLAQLARWTTDEVYAVVARRCSSHARQDSTARRSTARAIVASVHICPIDDDTVEACATVRQAGRARAVALRLEAFRGAWRCTAVSLG